MPETVGKYQVIDRNSEGNPDTYQNLMPLLREARLVPVSMADVMRERVNALNSNDNEQRAFWLKNYFHVGNGAAYNNKGRLRVVPYAIPLLDITPKTEVVSGIIILTPDQFYKMGGEEFTREELEQAGINRRLSEEEAKVHPVWLALARYDKDLLSDYAKGVFSEIKKRPIYNNDGMAVWTSNRQRDVLHLRPWVVGSLNGKSDAIGSSYLGDDAHLLGVEARSEGVPQNEATTLDDTVQRALGDGNAFKHNGRREF